MPDANGQMYLSDFRSELQARGFDGFSAADLNTLVNRGYLYIARKFPWYWKLDRQTLAYPSSGYFDVADTSTNFPGLKNIRSVILKNIPQSGQNQLLEAIDDEAYDTKYRIEFLNGTTGYSSVYYIEGTKLWVLPLLPSASQAQATVEVNYHKRPIPMASDLSVPVTPVDLDELILLAALVRCHKRANEPTLAAVAQAELEEAFDDLRDLEGDRLETLQERVLPDDSWA